MEYALQYALEDQKELAEKSLQVQQQLLEAFNRLAEKLDTLTDEVRQLRQEPQPKKLDKPRRPATEPQGN